MKDLIDNLRKNKLYQKNKSYKTLNKNNNNNNILKRTLSKNEMYVKQISFQTIKNDLTKLSKTSKKNNKQTVNNKSFNKRNNTSQNIFIKKDFSETEKLKNLKQLKSNNNLFTKDKKQMIKNVQVNIFDKIEKIEKNLKENILNKNDNQSIIDNQSEFSICDEFEIEKKNKNNDKTLRGSKSLGHFKIINMNQKFNNYLNENLSENNIKDKIKKNNNEGCWASCT